MDMSRFTQLILTHDPFASFKMKFILRSGKEAGMQIDYQLLYWKLVHKTKSTPLTQAIGGPKKSLDAKNSSMGFSCLSQFQLN